MTTGFPWLTKAMFGGMNPYGALAMSLGPALLGRLFQGKGQDWGAMRRNAQWEMSPEKIQSQGLDIFQSNINSPGYSMARSQMMGAGQAAQGAIQRNLGQTGGLRSGIGNAALGAAAAAPGIHMGQLSAQAWDNAMQQSTQRAMHRASIAMQGAPETMSRDLLAGGMNSLMPLIFKGMQPRQATNTGGMEDIDPRVLEMLKGWGMWGAGRGSEGGF